MPKCLLTVQNILPKAQFWSCSRSKSLSSLNLWMQVSIFCRQSKTSALKFILKTCFGWIGIETAFCDILFTLLSLHKLLNQRAENLTYWTIYPYCYLGGDCSLGTILSWLRKEKTSNSKKRKAFQGVTQKCATPFNERYETCYWSIHKKQPKRFTLILAIYGKINRFTYLSS